MHVQIARINILMPNKYLSKGPGNSTYLTFFCKYKIYLFIFEALQLQLQHQ